MPTRKRKQLQLPSTTGWGGARAGSGRKVRDVSNGPSHVQRIRHDPRHPVQVTLRARSSVPSLRSPTTFNALKRALGAASRARFRVIHFSVQTDHVHLIVEGDDARALTRGLQGLVIRCAFAVNRAAHRRGPVWSHRYHARELGTPSEVRRAMTYVLLNFRKHLRAPPGIDPRSSGVWFEEWSHTFEPSSWPRLVATPQTWLGSVGWRRAGGNLDVRAVPGASAKPGRQRPASAPSAPASGGGGVQSARSMR